MPLQVPLLVPWLLMQLRLLQLRLMVRPLLQLSPLPLPQGHPFPWAPRLPAQQLRSLLLAETGAHLQAAPQPKTIDTLQFSEANTVGFCVPAVATWKIADGSMIAVLATLNDIMIE